MALTSAVIHDQLLVVVAAAEVLQQAGIVVLRVREEVVELLLADIHDLMELRYPATPEQHQEVPTHRVKIQLQLAGILNQTELKYPATPEQPQELQAPVSQTALQIAKAAR